MEASISLCVNTCENFPHKVGCPNNLRAKDAQWNEVNKKQNVHIMIQFISIA